MKINDRPIKSMRSRISAPCTKSTARCDIAVDLTQNLPACCRSHTTSMMAGMQRVLDAAGVTWWIDYGSLLGAVRNPLMGEKPGIVAHDKDADCGIMAVDREKVLSIFGLVPSPAALDVMCDYDFGGAAGVCQVVYKQPRPRHEFSAGDSVKVRWSRFNQSNVDFFFWHDRGDGTLYRIRYIMKDRHKGREFPADKLLPLTTLEWEGLMLPAPREAEWFCEYRYGPNWMTPRDEHYDVNYRP